MALFTIVLKIIIGSVLLIAGFVLSQNWFVRDPLFKIPFLGQTLIAFLSATIGIYIIPYLVKIGVKGLKAWLAAVIRSSVSHSVGSFMATQAGRIKEGRVRRHAEGESIRSISEKDPSGRRPQDDGRGGGVILDTSAIIDGRILPVIHLGFVNGEVVVPTFVLNELQSLADSSDDLKRAKGRRGLDLLEKLKKQIGKRFELIDMDVEGKDVDEKLLKMAKKLEAKVVTVDFNLNKTGRVSGVEILNVNDLANELRTPLIPGQKVEIKIIHEGKDRKQGVGYLPDGTMIVVEEAKDKIGEKIEVEVSRFLQTSAGKMVFARLQRLMP